MRQISQIRDQHSFRIKITEIHDDYLVCAGTLPDGKKANIKVAKPYALRTSPFNGETVTYPQIGKSNTDQAVAYAYVDGTNYNKRVATYSSASTRCAAGDHVETIFPPYEVGNNILVSLNTVGNFEDTVAKGKLAVDENRDGRHWQDDCGSGGGAGAIWI
jgi:hypothetical protein